MSTFFQRHPIGICAHTGKRGYTRTDARALVKHYRRHPDGVLKLQHAYECGRCGMFHVTSMAPPPHTRADASNSR